MDLRDRLLLLVAPHGIGSELAPGARLVSASTELGLRLTFEVGGEHVHVEIARAGERSRFAAASGRLVFAYRARAPSPVDPALGLALCRAVAHVAAKNEEAVLDALEARAREGAHEGRVRRVRVSSLLEEAGRDGETCYMLSPYVGCLIGCRFCYAQSRTDDVRRLCGLPPVPWGSWVDVRVNAPEILAGELARLPPRPIKLCPIVSDPYQTVERDARVTRRCLEVIRAARGGFPVLVLTRSELILEDLQLIAALDRAFVGVSLPSVDEEVCRHFEPRASSAARRLEVLRAFREAGVATMAVVQPLLPGDLDALADALCGAVTSVSIEVLRGTYAAAPDFADPRYAPATADGWQRERAQALADKLRERGIVTWEGELPPELA